MTVKIGLKIETEKEIEEIESGKGRKKRRDKRRERKVRKRKGRGDWGGKERHYDEKGISNLGHHHPRQKPLSTFYQY